MVAPGGVTAEEARQAILESGWDPKLITRRLQLWEFKAIQGAPMSAIAERLEMSERAAWNDWKQVNTLLGSIELPKLIALRARQLARREYLYWQVMRQLADDRAAQRDVNPELVRTADRLLAQIDELYALVTRTPVVNVNAVSPFMEALGRQLGSMNGHENGGDGGPGRDRLGRFAPSG